MANGTVCLRVNPQFVHQFGTDLGSRSLTLCRLPVELRDQLHRADMLFGMAVAFDAPRHRQRLILINLLHRVDATVASDAAHTAIDVGGVIEEDKIRQSMNAYPRDRFT